ncbi:MAG: GNAT family protein [Anaerolineales bacterium]
MFTTEPQLLEAQDVRLGSIDFETHPAVESRWTHDAEFIHLMELSPSLPLSPAMVKKQYEAIEREMNEQKDLFYFTIRAREDDRLLGKALIEYVDWSHGNGYLRLGLGEVMSRRKGYGSQALSLLLQYAFCELSLYRLTAVVPAYNEGAMRLFQKFGFIEETRRSKALHYNDKFWDVIGLGLLNSEYRVM